MGLEYKRQRESKRAEIKKNSYDDWVWDFDMDKVIYAYHAFFFKRIVGDIPFIWQKTRRGIS